VTRLSCADTVNPKNEGRGFVEICTKKESSEQRGRQSIYINPDEYDQGTESEIRKAIENHYDLGPGGRI